MAYDDISSLQFVEQYVHVDSIGSTQDLAKQLESFPGAGIAVIHADVQTQGRGQRGNSFYSGAGGLYATIVCPLSDIGAHFVLNRAVSLAVIESLEAAALSLSAPLSIKWPNDILWAGKKICGVLLESVPRSPGHIAVGFGINVNTETDDFPAEIRGGATSMLVESGTRINVRALLSEICVRFQNYRFAPASEAHERYLGRLRGLGERVRTNGRTGVFETVAEDGRLCMHTDGKSDYFSSGPMYFIDYPSGEINRC